MKLFITEIKYILYIISSIVVVSLNQLDPLKMPLVSNKYPEVNFEKIEYSVKFNLILGRYFPEIFSMNSNMRTVFC